MCVLQRARIRTISFVCLSLVTAEACKMVRLKSHGCRLCAWRSNSVSPMTAPNLINHFSPEGHPWKEERRKKIPFLYEQNVMRKAAEWRGVSCPSPLMLWGALKADRKRCHRRPRMPRDPLRCLPGQQWGHLGHAEEVSARIHREILKLFYKLDRNMTYS